MGNTKSVEIIELNVKNIASTTEQPLVIPSQNQTNETTEMYAKRFKGLVYSKEHLAQKRVTIIQHH